MQAIGRLRRAANGAAVAVVLVTLTAPVEEGAGREVYLNLSEQLRDFADQVEAMGDPSAEALTE